MALGTSLSALLTVPALLGVRRGRLQPGHAVEAPQACTPPNHVPQETANFGNKDRRNQPS